MTKEEFKEYICNQIDLMESEEISELSQFLKEKNENETIAEELIVIKGEFKKLTKLVQQMQTGLESIKKEHNKDELKTFITLYSFIKNSKDALDSMPQNSMFGVSKFNRAFGAFENGFKSIDILYADILKSIDLKPSAKAGEKFDPEIHEAVEVIEDKNIEDATIVEVLEEGFLYKDKLLNYAKVKVNRWTL
ncbi:Heat shock protein GrpE [hydrothermal vent metagenome]|uniref:Heat shock protein GrpE n=1 Tax=hydrothermal vent metagenome TaxID=652676 RepID=A0A1W1C9P0_9ZZZZ